MREKIKSFFLQSVRVWRVLKKPTMMEYKTVAKVSAIGILLLGLFGFIIAGVVKAIA